MAGYRMGEIRLKDGGRRRAVILPAGASADDIKAASRSNPGVPVSLEGRADVIPAGAAPAPTPTPQPAVAPVASQSMAEQACSVARTMAASDQRPATPRPDPDDGSDVVALIAAVGLKGFKPTDQPAAESPQPSAITPGPQAPPVTERQPDDASDVLALIAAAGLKGFGDATA